MAWTTADLLTTVKTRGMIPDASSGSLSSASLLNLASEELLITLVPMILSVREKYYETYSDTAVTTATLSIPIPARSIGGTLSVVQYIYNGRVRVLEPIDPGTITTTTAGTPTNFYFENNSVVLYPPPAQALGTVRLRYFQRPSRLEQTANCAQVTSFDTVAKTVTCSGGVPSTWTAATSLDFVPQTASQATPYGLSTAATGVTGSVISFGAALPTALAVGDWLAAAEYTPIPELPFEFQVVLAQATVAKAMEAIKDQEGLTNAAAKLGAYQKSAVLLLTPRDQGGKKKVVSGWRGY